MSTSATAIVTDGHGHFELMDVQLGDPHPGEVLVELKASGVCHTDFDSLSWKRQMIIGHEAAGLRLQNWRLSNQGESVFPSRTEG